MVIALRILLDHHVPVGVRDFLARHEVSTISEMHWPPQIENGELLKAAEAHNFDVLLTSDQNIRYQQDLSRRKLALVVLGSNIWPTVIWPIVRNHRGGIRAAIEKSSPGSYLFVEMPLPKKPQKRSPKR
jgi:hypothetical protein